MSDQNPTSRSPGRLVRPYALTGGRTRSIDHDFPLETLVMTTEAGVARERQLVGEQRAIARLCISAVSVIEVAARIGVPLGVARVLVGDMAADGLVAVHRPRSSDRPDLQLLERVLGGIRAL